MSDRDRVIQLEHVVREWIRARDLPDTVTFRQDEIDYAEKALRRALSLEHPPQIVHAFLAADGFHRIGRIDASGSRSLWLREEPDAIELRSGRSGDDYHVRITRAN